MLGAFRILKNIFALGELKKDSVTEKISATASDGKKVCAARQYNLVHGMDDDGENLGSIGNI